MAVNWSGTYAITTPGTTATATSSTTLTNSGAAWPTGTTLVNWYVRILTGTNSGQKARITANTATQITVASWPGGTPGSTCTYELVLILEDQDHITGALSIGNNCITEIATSSTVLVNGAYGVTITGSATVRWGMAAGTLSGFDANTRTTSCTIWTGITTDSTVSVAPAMTYLRIRDSNYMLTAVASTGLGAGSTVHHLWGENQQTSAIDLTGAAITANQTISNIFNRWSIQGIVRFTTSSNSFIQTMANMWIENWTTNGSQTWLNGSAAGTWLRDCVFKFVGSSSSLSDIASGKFQYFTDMYYIPGDHLAQRPIGQLTASAAGTYVAACNTFLCGMTSYAGSACNARVSADGCRG